MNCADFKEFCEIEEIDDSKNYLIVSRMHENLKFEIKWENMQEIMDNIEYQIQKIDEEYFKTRINLKENDLSLFFVYGKESDKDTD